ncbi:MULTISPECIES: patatin-like phospholipase family protein [Sphingobacterium]|uniref:Patatin-like phospholipase family protein n=1 Tax=Sphingobacterium populi TaxID=1812824 RepID=A0ABW5UE35_9SPHI|nr:patatin-like phospholipase family protein [Sphingobacterium sp. CFCC 11742]
MKRILSIDGGGIRGIIPGMVLLAMEQRLQDKTKNSDAHLSEYFDFFTGTSTGGILIAIMLCPHPDDASKPRFYAKEALDIYLKYGPSIFSTTRWRRFLSKFGLLSELYDATILESILDQYFGDVKLSELLKPAIMTAYNIELRKNHIFRQQKAISHGDTRDFYIKDVCRATAAAPTYFSVAEIFSIAGTRFPLLDGGVFAHNPALSGLLEMLKTYDTFKIDDVHILSLGTGVAKNVYNYDDFKKKWAISIGPALVDIMTSSSSESTDYFLKQLFRSVHKASQYTRIEPNNVSSISPAMDDASPSNIQKLISLADNVISDYDEVINTILDDLIVDKEQLKDNSVWNFLRRK